MEDELRMTDKQFEQLLLDESMTSGAREDVLTRAETSPEIGQSPQKHRQRQNMSEWNLFNLPQMM